MNKIIRRILLFICICVFLFSAFQLGKIFYNYYTIEKESAELVTQYVEEPEEEKEAEGRRGFSQRWKRYGDYAPE